MKQIMIIFMLLFLFVGCGGTKIYLNGSPAGTHISMLTHIETGMKAYYTASVHYGKKEGNELLECSYHVPFNTVIEIPKEVTALTISLRLINEKKVKYNLWEKYSIVYVDGSNPYRTEHKLYSGSLSMKNFQISCSTDVMKGNYSFEIRDSEDNCMFFIGKLLYERR